MTRLWTLCCVSLVLAACGEREAGAPAKDRSDLGEESIICTSGDDCPFGQRCVGGVCSSSTAPPVSDRCMTDDDCLEGEGCATSTGICVVIADEPTVEPDLETDCEPGTHRPCGSKIGACEYGVQQCFTGVWEACEGGVGPSTEICNGIDDNCDGTVDEGTDGSCNDTLYCNGVELCQGGGCVPGAPPNCSTLDDGCNEGMCDERLAGCRALHRPDNTPCEDGLFCSVDDVCFGGTCRAGPPRECSASGGSCRDGVCDEGADACTGAPVQNGTSCDDGLFCTNTTTCTAGECGGGTPVNCSGLDDTCNDGVCDEADSACKKQPKSNGTACDDGFYCTVSTTCTGGSCAGGDARNCAGSADACNNGVCNETTNGCEADPKPVGTSCSDGAFCTVGETCTSGSCGGGSSRDCSAAGDQCNDGVCNDGTNLCEAAPKSNGTGCNDGLFCTTPDTCTLGVCGGDARDCSAVSDACNGGVCNENSNACEPGAAPDHTRCDDFLFCTTDDECLSGSCVGSTRDCTAHDDQCHQGVCNEGANICQPQAAFDGEPCDDDLWCKQGSECAGGFCTGGSERTDCSNPGCWGYCDEAGDRCVCDSCATGSPTANAGPDQDAVPDETVLLDGTSSSNPTSQALTYAWRVDSRPDGSTAPLSDPTSSNPTLLADVSGDFVVCLSVTDADDCPSDEDCMTVTVAPQVALHVELVWDIDDSDVDLHYRAPGGAFFAGCENVYNTDAYFLCMTPDWGPGGAVDGDPDNDPRLDVDNVLGFGPENINQDELFDAGPFTVGVHYYRDKNGGTAVARVRIFVDGMVALEDTRSFECGEFWEVADLEVSGNGTVVGITPVDAFYDFGGPGCEWTCVESYYGDGYCDCGCNTPDVDCNGGGCVDCCTPDCDYCFVEE